jgi:hypothetical protein
MEWFSALEVAKCKKSSKEQHKCLPISRDKQKQESSIKTQKIFKESTLQRKRSMAKATIYECFGIGPRRYILGP